MEGSAKWLLWICLVLATQLEPVAVSRVVCYYTNWSIYYGTETGRFAPQDIDPNLCTHIIYAFGGLSNNNEVVPFDYYQDIENGGYVTVTNMKKNNSQLKTMLGIGGWTEGSKHFSPLSADPVKRRKFIGSTIQFLRHHNFDGLDLDWQFPTFRDSGKPEDRNNYAQLIKELRKGFEAEANSTGNPRLLLSMALPVTSNYIEKGYDLLNANRYLDWMSTLTYDYHSAFEAVVNHHSPLYAVEEGDESNIDFSIKYYLNAGVDPQKLVLGIPTFGRSFTLVNSNITGIGAPSEGAGNKGSSTEETGYLAYFEICEKLYLSDKSINSSTNNGSWTIVQPNADVMGPYAYSGDQWVGFDDVDIVKKKAQFAAEKGLGGIMFWSIDNDDFHGRCHGKPYPIINAGKESFFKTPRVTTDETTTKKEHSTTSLKETSTERNVETRVVQEDSTSINGIKKGALIAG